MDRSQSSAILNIGGVHEASPSYVPLMVGCAFGALDAAFLLCQAPHPPAPYASHARLFVRSMVDVVASALMGVGASLLIWSRLREGTRLPRRQVILASATVSVWAPCLVLFYRQDSAWVIPFSVLSAVVVALCWRTILPLESHHARDERAARELFAETLHPLPPWNRTALWLALCVYAGLAEICDHDPITASGLLMVFSFSVSWQSIQPRGECSAMPHERKRATMRLVGNGMAALLITYIGLHAWNPKGNRSVAQAATTTQKNAQETPPKTSAGNAHIAVSRFQSIVLWSIPENKKFELPPPPGVIPAIDRLSEPLVITFTGAYWYFQPPHTAPGSTATVAHGSPLLANVRATNSIPLLMEAHQKLRTRVSLDCCRSIRVEFETCDNLPGDTSLGVALEDNRAGQKPAMARSEVSLGSQDVAPAAPLRLMSGCIPRPQAMEFAIPQHAPLRRFNEITVFFSTDPTRSEIGARMALKQFELIPR